MKFIAFLLLLLLGLIGFGQDQYYPKFPAVGKSHDSTVKQNTIILWGDVLKSDDFIYLNYSDQFVEGYQQRYDYCSKRTSEDVVYHPSRVYEGDTSSISMRNLYVDIHPSFLSDRYVPITYIKNTPVTTSEWRDFQMYIRDSTLLRNLANNTGDMEVFLKPTYQTQGADKMVTDEYQWNLNWKVLKSKKVIKKDYPETVHYTKAYLCYTPHERWNFRKEMDARKLTYTYYQIQYDDAKEANLDPLYYRPIQDQIKINRSNHNKDPFFEKDLYTSMYSSAYVDSTLWKFQTKNHHDGDMGDQMAMNYFNAKDFEEAPITGITSLQAKAYLDWLQKKHQQELDKKELPYYVEYVLPTPSELDAASLTMNEYKVEVNAMDLAGWRISNIAYKEFVEYCMDSVLLEMYKDFLLEDDMEGYYQPTYDDELQLKDWYEWRLKMQYADKLLKKDTADYFKQLCYPEDLTDKSIQYDWDYRKAMFRYYEMDYQLSSKLGNPKVNDYYVGLDSRYECTKPRLMYPEESRYYNETSGGKDLLLTGSNLKCQNADVLSHQDRSRFIEQKITGVYPGFDCFYCNDCYIEDYEYKEDSCCPSFYEGGYEENRLPTYDFDSNPDASVKINYRQAVAFYQWKAREKGAVLSISNTLYRDYIPSEEEWTAIQKGEKVIHEKEIYQLPTPTFTYCIKLYPKPSYIPPLEDPIQLYGSYGGGELSAKGKDRKEYLKAINSTHIQNLISPDGVFQVLQNKTTKKLALTDKDGEPRLLQEFDGFNLKSDLTTGYLEVLRGGKKSPVNFYGWYQSAPDNYFDELDYSRTEEGIVLVKDSGLWGAYYPSLDLLMEACVYTTKEEVPTVDTYGLDYLTSYIYPLKDQGFKAFKPDGNGDGCFYAMNAENKWGFYQMDTEKIPPVYDSIMPVGYNKPFTLVYQNGKVGAFKGFFSTPSESVPCIYEEAKRVRYDGYYYFAAKKDGKWGWVDWSDGKLLSEFKCESYEKLPYPSEDW